MSDEERGVEEVPVEEVPVAEAAAEEPATEPMTEPPAEEPAMAPEEEPAAMEPPAMEPAAMAPAESATEPAPVTAAPMTEMVEPEETLSPRKHTGLIVVIASIVIILLTLVFTGPALYTAVIKQSTSSGTTATSAPAKTKITVAIGFVKALLNGDTLAIKGFLPPNVQSAITDKQWADLAAQDATPVVEFSDPKWSGDTTAVVILATTDTTGTLTFGLDAAKPLAVVMNADIAGTTERDTITLVQVGSDWRVASISNGNDTTVFDEKLIKSMVATATAEPATSTP